MSNYKRWRGFTNSIIFICENIWVNIIGRTIRAEHGYRGYTKAFVPLMNRKFREQYNYRINFRI